MNGVVPATTSVISYIRDKTLNDDDFTKSLARSKDKLLKEFEKPVKIYSYLSLRQKYHPIFLNRNLNYTDKPRKNTNQSILGQKNVYESLFKTAKRFLRIFIIVTEKYKLKFTFRLIIF